MHIFLPLSLPPLSGFELIRLIHDLMPYLLFCAGPVHWLKFNSAISFSATLVQVILHCLQFLKSSSYTDSEWPFVVFGEIYNFFSSIDTFSFCAKSALSSFV